MSETIEELKEVLALARAAIDAERRRADAAEARLLFLEGQLALAQMQLAGRSPLRGSAHGGSASAGIPPDLLPILIQCCHPDKHGGSPAATKATDFLLRIRP